MEDVQRAHEWAKLLAGTGEKWHDSLPVDGRKVRSPALIDKIGRDAYWIGSTIIYRRADGAWMVRGPDPDDDADYDPANDSGYRRVAR